MCTGVLISDFLDGGQKSFLNLLLRVGCASYETLFEGLHVGRGYEDIDGVKICLFDLANTLVDGQRHVGRISEWGMSDLSLDVQDAAASLSMHLFYSTPTCAV